MKNLPHLYPLKFEPILKEKVWGGNKLHQLFNKKNENSIGESWELSGVEGNVSIVSNGELAGKSLQELLNFYKEDLVGESIYQAYGKKFPLLFKFIDAREALSVQVHPDDILAKKRHNSFGKTEMWYILDAEDEASIIVGFDYPISKEKYLELVENKKIAEALKVEKVKTGDAFVLLPGTIHAIGAGVVLAEIQQTSDITYRIYDWDRPDVNGQLRELHNVEAVDAINFDLVDTRSKFDEKLNDAVQIGRTDYFSVNKLQLSKNIFRQIDFSSSFKVYMCVAGNAIIVADDFSEEIQIGETILVPACFEKIEIKTTGVTLLETYIP